MPARTTGVLHFWVLNKGRGYKPKPLHANAAAFHGPNHLSTVSIRGRTSKRNRSLTLAARMAGTVTALAACYPASSR